MKPITEPPAFSQLRHYVETQSERAAATTRWTQAIRDEERAYARECIRTSWIIAALLTAVFAWVAWHPPFALPPPLVQVVAVGVNGLLWWVLTSGIWFKKMRKRKP